MLFAAKRHWGTSLLALALCWGAGAATAPFAGLAHGIGAQPDLPRHAALGLAAILLSDGLVHGVCLVLFRERYQRSFRALADYLRPRGWAEIPAGGLLAGAGEEWIFRGVLLGGLLDRAGLAPAAAVALSAGVFGLFHLTPHPRLAPFAMWAGLQGLILGTLYVLSGSLLACALVHAAHDAAGLLLFSRPEEARPNRNHPRP